MTIKAALLQARQAMKTWETGAVKDKAEIDRLKAELEKTDGEKFTERDRDIAWLSHQLSAAKEALKAIEKHQKVVMKDSGLVMSATYMIAERALQTLGETGE